MFDIIYNNSSKIDPDILSTDTHGTNKVNFAILHTFGYQFAPRYKNLSKRKNIIYSFSHPNKYKSSLIKPTRKINKKLIVEEWDNIQRILVSLALKNTIQSVIVRKLSSYARSNRTKRALWELDNIIKSFHNLNYIDDINLRQNIQKALNRGENYHRLIKNIAYADGGKFRVKTEEEQNIFNECSRLIANCIIYYNAYILSKLLLAKKKENNKEEVNIIKNISPVAWYHINLYGKYEFNNRLVDINIENILTSIKIEKLATRN